MIEFKDGLHIDNNGELRVEEQGGQAYVLGEGICFPVADAAAGMALIRSIETREVFLNMKVFKSKGARSRVEEVLAAESARLRAAGEPEA